MRRGDIFRVHKPKHDDPKRYRFYVLVSRQELIDSTYSTVVCAPIYTRGRGLFTQVPVGVADGLKHDSWITCDNLRSISKSELTQFVGSLSKTKIDELNIALTIALDLD
ncbi:MAG TPA: type II toxin-antitoxin system PemK/MazF family toxin [Candidatus Dormibacteraeota bacterium]|nr:type II toxin-antitoxin system PemK/MazF family toxin [Candidatus Dormibacteraeota bacterium]